MCARAASFRTSGRSISAEQDIDLKIYGILIARKVCTKPRCPLCDKQVELAKYAHMLLILMQDVQSTMLQSKSFEHSKDCS
jgi:hypothetical protein